MFFLNNSTEPCISGEFCFFNFIIKGCGFVKSAANITIGLDSQHSLNFDQILDKMDEKPTGGDDNSTLQNDVNTRFPFFCAEMLRP